MNVVNIKITTPLNIQLNDFALQNQNLNQILFNRIAFAKQKLFNWGKEKYNRYALYFSKQKPPFKGFFDTTLFPKIVKFTLSRKLSSHPS